MWNTKESKDDIAEYENGRIKFRRNNVLGGGGNGDVFQIKIVEGKDYLQKEWPDLDLEKLVAKFFSCNQIKKIEERERRYKRFCREVEKQGILCNEITGIIPILAFHCPIELPVENSAWYIMPEANVFKVSSNIPVVEKLKQMLELANVILQIHKKGIMHRDIKPDNIFYYKNHMCLGDFGLVWATDVEPLTTFGERIGPIKILPPELEHMEEIRGIDYRYSDVYLFAKVLWMYVKRDGYGFRGEYMRGMSQVYLDKNKLGIISLEPLHELLEKATMHKWQERILIEECIEFIKEQIAICEDSIFISRLNQYIYQEELAYFQSTVEPNVKVYVNNADVYDCLGKMIKYCTLIVSDKIENYEINPISIQKEDNNLFLITEKINENYIKRYLMDIERMEIGKVHPIIYTKKYELKNEKFVSMADIVPSKFPVIKQIAFDGNYVVKIIAKENY